MSKSKLLFFSFLGILEIGLAILSFVLQLKINQFDKNISINKDEIARTDIEIKILKTEISHLTSITKIKDISNTYLPNYKNITPNDFVRVIDIPVNPQFE